MILNSEESYKKYIIEQENVEANLQNLLKNKKFALYFGIFIFIFILFLFLFLFLFFTMQKDTAEVQ
jgi:ATP-dependent Zn protease